MLTLPPPLLVIVADTPPVKEAEIAAVLPAVIVVVGAPATVNVVITGLTLSTCSVPFAVAVDSSPAVSVAVKDASPSASVAVLMSNAYSGGVAAVVDALKLVDPAASFTLCTPLAARAVTKTRTVPLRKSAAVCPSAPTTATDVPAVDVPAMHFPAGPHTGKSFGHDASSTQGISPPEVSEQPASASEAAERTPMVRSFDVSIMPALDRPAAAGPASRISQTQKAKSAAAIPAATRPPANPA